MLLLVMAISIGNLRAGFTPIIIKNATAAEEAKAKNFESDPQRALIYVYRDNSFLGGSAKSQFVVNNVAVADTGKGQFNVVSLAPGKYDFLTLSAGESNTSTMLIHNSNKVSVQLSAEAGKLYFYQVMFKPMGGFSLKSVTEEEAKPMIKKNKMKSFNQF